MRVLRSHPTFAALWTAGLFSAAAGWALGFALSVHVFESTGSVTASAALLIVSLGSTALLGGVVGALADRVDRIVLIRGASALRVAIVLGLIASEDLVVMTLVLAAANAVATQAAATAEQATVAAVVPRDRLPDAVGMNSFAVNAARLGSPALGGVLMTAVGYGWTLTVVAITLLAGIGALVFVRVRARGSDSASFAFGPLSVRELTATPTTRIVTAVQLLDAVKEGALTTLFPVLMLQVIGASEAVMGVVNSSFAFSAIVAGPVSAVLMRRLGARPLVAWGAAIPGALLLLLALAPSEATAFVAFAGAGFPFTLSWAAMSALLLLSVRPGALGRVVGSLSGLNAGVTAASSLAAGLIAEQLGTGPVLVVASLVQIGAGVVARAGLPSPARGNGVVARS